MANEPGKVMAVSGGKLLKLSDVLELVVGNCGPTINLFSKFLITKDDIVVDYGHIDT